MISATPFVFDWVREHAERLPDAPAVGTPQHGWTSYGELQAAVVRCAGMLHGSGHGTDAFVVMAVPASAASVASGLAVQSLGSALVEVSRDLGRDGFAEILHQTRSRLAIVAGRDVAVWADLARAEDTALDHLVVVHAGRPPASMTAVLDGIRWTLVSDNVADWSDALDPPSAELSDADHGLTPESTALLVYTSGSTGVPRAVIQTHGNIDANTRAIARYLALDSHDRAMATLPLFYCYGRSVLQTHLAVGASIYFDHRFMYPAVVFGEIAAQGCTSFAGVPLTFESLRRQLDIEGLDLPSLRYVTQAGGAMHPDTIRWVREAFAPAVLYVMYGQTEATSRLTYLPPEHGDEKAGSVGKALDNLELRVVDEHGEPVPAGTVGSVVARGPSVTPGYFEEPDDTAEIMRDGWLETGDLGYLDNEGFLYLAGRTKDFLKLGGHRVSAGEIEDVLARHPDVAAVAVVGATGSDGAEQAVAFVIAAPGTTPDEAVLRRHCRLTMPAFKVPRFVRFTDELPLTTSNKVAKSVLQKRITDDPTILS